MPPSSVYYSALTVRFLRHPHSNKVTTPATPYLHISLTRTHTTQIFISSSTCSNQNDGNAVNATSFSLSRLHQKSPVLVTLIWSRQHVFSVARLQNSLLARHTPTRRCQPLRASLRETKTPTYNANHASIAHILSMVTGSPIHHSPYRLVLTTARCSHVLGTIRHSSPSGFSSST